MEITTVPAVRRPASGLAMAIVCAVSVSLLQGLQVRLSDSAPITGAKKSPDYEPPDGTDRSTDDDLEGRLLSRLVAKAARDSTRSLFPGVWRC